MLRHSRPTPGRRAFTLALVLAALPLAACSKPEPPRLTPRAVQVTSVSPTMLGLRVELDAYNPNGFVLPVRSLKARVTVAEGVELGAVEVPSGLSLAPKAHSPVVADLQLPWRNAPDVARLAANQPSVPYHVNGTALVGGESVNFEVPFQLDGTLTREQLVEAGLRGLSKFLTR